MHPLRCGSAQRGGRLGWILLWLSIWLLAMGLARPAAGANLPATTAVELNAAERQWVAGHPTVRVGLTRDFPPYYIYNAQADQSYGFVVELMALWSQRSGLQFEFHHYDHADDVMRAVQHGEVDMTPFTAPLDRQRGRTLYTRPAFFSNLVVATRRDVPDISPTADFAGRRVAVEEDSSVDALLDERFPRAQVQRWPSTEAALRAVASGQSDLFIGYQHVAVYQIEKHLLANIELRRNLGPGAIPLGPAVRPDAPLLRDILDRCIATTTLADRSRLAERWLPAASTRVPLPAASAQLTVPEQQWVNDHGRVRVGYDASFSPVTMRGPLGEFLGFGADMFRLVAAKAGLSVELERGATFAEIYQQGKDGELDVIVGMARTPNRRADYDFVGPFLSVPTVLITRIDETAIIADTPDIGPRRLVLLRNHFLIPELKARHPGISLLEVERQDQVLSAVAEGAAEVGLGNLSVVNELLERRYAGKVSISGIVRNGDSELYFGVPRNRPELTRVLSRALEAVNDSETAALRARWLAREVRTGFSLEQVLRVAVPLGLLTAAIVAGLVLFNRHLARARGAERVAREMAEESTADRSRFLSYLSHELRGTLMAVSAGADLLKRNDDPTLRNRLIDALAYTANGLRDLLDNTLRHEQSLHKPVPIEPEWTVLAQWWEQCLAPTRLAAERGGVEFLAEWHGQGAVVRMDGARVQQVLQNLLQNALKFTPAGQVQVIGELLELPGQPDGRRELRLDVLDDGPGLSDADRAILFRPYAQGEEGRRVHQGAGLGLAISRHLMRVMGGRLEALPNRPGHGAHFRVSLAVDCRPPKA